MGADVIKIEPLTGAAERGSSRAKITSPLFALVNRNKRSVSLDLKSEEVVLPLTLVALLCAYTPSLLIFAGKVFVL